MIVRRVLQSLIALALCAALAAALGGFYFAPAIAATLIAMSTGVYVLLAVAAGLVWPVLAVAWVLYVTRDARLRAEAAHGGARSPASGETDLARVEDP